MRRGAGFFVFGGSVAGWAKSRISRIPLGAAENSRILVYVFIHTSWKQVPTMNIFCSW
jgi:hypothetical protein